MRVHGSALCHRFVEARSLLIRRYAPFGRALSLLRQRPRWQSGTVCAAAAQQHICHAPGVHLTPPTRSAQVMIMAHDRERGRLAFSTKKLEPAPGDMLRDPAKVFASAEDMAELFKVRALAGLTAPQQLPLASRPPPLMLRCDESVQSRSSSTEHLALCSPQREFEVYICAAMFRDRGVQCFAVCFAI